MKKIIFLFVLFILLLPKISANMIELTQNFGWVTYWNEDKLIYHTGDLNVTSHIKLELNESFSSQNYTIGFLPWEPHYDKEPKNFNITILTKCMNGADNLFSPSECNGQTLKNGKDFIIIKEDKYKGKQMFVSITIFNNSKEAWTSYHIFIDYLFENFAKKKNLGGSEYYVAFQKGCNGHKGYNDDTCPKGPALVEHIYIDPVFRILDISIEAKIKIDNKGTEYFTLIGNYEYYTLRFDDLYKKEVILPFFWALVGAFLGAILGIEHYKNKKNIQKELIEGTEELIKKLNITKIMKRKDEGTNKTEKLKTEFTDKKNTKHQKKQKYRKHKEKKTKTRKDKK
ncbi:MAG TPA: hypothetical protein VI894_02380 [Candidatus Nanoarchaeia archaeon]|nr:hypothetical protein [Candidatus Nanoarchaeia archaeon]